MSTTQRLVILTGPNMAGKSTYIRQVAVLALLAHCGCFVPGASARWSACSTAFSPASARATISARGQSTFMVEMNETANILNHATSRSLVDPRRDRARHQHLRRPEHRLGGRRISPHHACARETLFATHYHELTELAPTLPASKNYNVAVREWGDQIVFLRKIVPGGTDKSYGIQVARLAGLPASVLNRAKEILRQLEDSELDEKGKPKLGQRPPEPPSKTKSAKKMRESDLAEMDLFQSARPKT